MSSQGRRWAADPRSIRSKWAFTEALRHLRDDTSSHLPVSGAPWTTVAGLNQALGISALDRNRLKDSTLTGWLRNGAVPEDFDPLSKFLTACGVPPEKLPDWDQARKRVRALTKTPPISTDRARALGVHEAITTDDPELRGQLTIYVERAHDSELREALARENVMFVVAVGESSTGKTRATLEAVLNHPRVGRWSLVHPPDGRALAALIEEGIESKTVVWLNETQKYFDSPEASLFIGPLTEILKSGRELVFVGSMWQQRDWDRYFAIPMVIDDLHKTAHSSNTAIRELLSLPAVHKVDVPPGFGAEYLSELAKASRVDSRLAEAIRTAGTDGRVIQTLAGGTQLLAMYHLFAVSSDRVTRAAWAIITAAVDARRIGWESPLTHAFLEEGASAYLVGQFRAQERGWYESALERAQTPIHGIYALTPTRNQGSEIGPADRSILHDYLFQSIELSRRREPIPLSLWDAVSRHSTDKADRLRLARSAFARAIWFDAQRHDISETGVGLITTLVSPDMSPIFPDFYGDPVFQLGLLLRALGKTSYLQQLVSAAGDSYANTFNPSEASLNRLELYDLAALQEAVLKNALKWLAELDVGDELLRLVAERDPRAVHALINLLSKRGIESSIELCVSITATSLLTTILSDQQATEKLTNKLRYISLRRLSAVEALAELLIAQGNDIGGLRCHAYDPVIADTLVEVLGLLNDEVGLQDLAAAGNARAVRRLSRLSAERLYAQQDSGALQQLALHGNPYAADLLSWLLSDLARSLDTR